MKTITILKKMINIYYYLIIIALAVEAIKVMYHLILGDTGNLKPRFLNGALDYTDPNHVITVISNIVALALLYFFLLAIERIKHTVNELEKNNYFNSIVINNFRRVGIMFLIFAAVQVFAKIIFPLLFSTIFKVPDISTPLLFTLMGLFFMFLGEVFKVAKEEKEENELTI